jgi:hypothetical protein
MNDLARDILTRVIADRLVKLFQHEDVRCYDGQILEAREFVKAVGDFLCVMPRGEFSEKVIQASIVSVAEVYDALCTEEPVEVQRVIPFKPWRDGIRIQ